MLCKLNRILFFALNVVSSNPYVRPSLRIKIFFCYQHVQKTSYLLQKLLHFYQIHYLPIHPFLPNPFLLLPNLLPTEKAPFISNPIPNPEYIYLSMSVSFTNLTAPNKEFSSLGLLLST